MEIVAKSNFQPKGFYQGGFTLIEILVVVFIIGIMVSVVGLRIGGSDARVGLLEAKRFIQVVREVQDLSVISGKPYALAFNPLDRSYGFMHNPPDWTVIEDDRLLKTRTFPENFTFEVTVEKIDNSGEEIVNDNSSELSDLSSGDISQDKIVEVKTLKDQVLISPVGEMTPFTLTLLSGDIQLQIALNEEQRLEAKRL